MAQDLEKLVVTLSADIRSYEKAFAKASSLTVSALRGIQREAEIRGRGIERAMNSASAGLARFGNSFKELGAGLLAGFTAKAFIDAIAGAVDKLAELGEMAERIGVTTDALQALQRMAVLTGASVGEMDKALQSLAEQSAEKGSFLDKLFEANGQVLSNDVETNIRKFMDLMQNAQSAQERLLIATKVFGDKVGRALVEAFSKGGAEVDRILAGLIASSEHHSAAQIKEMQEIRAKYILYMDDISQHWASIVVSLIEKSGEWFNFQRANLAAMERDLGALGQAFMKMAFPAQGITGNLDKLIARQAELTKSISEGLPGNPLIESYKAELAVLEKQIAARKVLNQVVNPSDVIAHRVGEAGLGTGKTATAAKTKLPLTPEEISAEKARLKELADAYAETDKIINDLSVQAAEDRSKALADALQADIDKMDEVRSVAQDMFQGVLQGIKDGASAGEILNGILDKLESKMIDLASTGFADLLFGAQGTAGGGFLGKLLGSGFKTFARGGISRSPAIFAEHGPEAAVPLPDGRRIPVDLRLPSSARLPSRGGGGPQINVKVINNNGSAVQTQMGRGTNGPELQVVIDNAVDKYLLGGRGDKAMRGRFGAQPAARRRT